MIFPEYIKKGDTIAVTAPSDGNKDVIDIVRLNRAKDALCRKGIKVILTDDVTKSIDGRSAPAQVRAKEFFEAWMNDDVKAVISAKGGDYLMEMLSYLPFEELAKKPKWFQGYSDNTSIGFILTTKYDIASVYCNNFNDFASEIWHESVQNNWDILCGNKILQRSFEMYQDGFFKGETGAEGYDLSVRTNTHCIAGKNDQMMTGRLAGGCLDVLLNIVGTRFDDVRAFTEKYADDGIIWFFETFSLTGEDIQRGLWQLREAGWLNNAKGFIFGRPAFYSSFSEVEFNDAVLCALSDLNVPIITEADIGHKPPQFTMINGSLCTAGFKDDKFQIEIK